MVPQNAFKAFIKPFEAPQRSVKIKVLVKIRPGAGRKGEMYQHEEANIINTR